MHPQAADLLQSSLVGMKALFGRVEIARDLAARARDAHDGKRKEADADER